MSKDRYSWEESSRSEVIIRRIMVVLWVVVIVGWMTLAVLLGWSL